MKREQEEQPFNPNGRFNHWEKLLVTDKELPITAKDLYSLGVDILAIENKLDLKHIAPGEEDMIDLQGSLGEIVVIRYNQPLDLDTESPYVTIQNFLGLQPGWFVIHHRRARSLPISLPLITPRTSEYITFKQIAPNKKQHIRLTQEQARIIAEDIWKVYKEHKSSLDVFRDAFKNDGGAEERI